MKKISLLMVLLLYLLTRLVAILTLPIFIDEAFYLALSRQIYFGQASLLVSLTHGLPPLYIWVLTLLVAPFPFDPLLLGRILSVFFSLLTLILIMRIAQENFSDRAAFFGGLVYIFLPFSLVYDRLSLQDPLLQLFGTFVLFLIFKKSGSIWHELLIGLILGLAILTKSSAYFYLLLLPTILCIKKFKYIKRLLLITILSILIASILYIFPEARKISNLNSLFIASPVELLANPFRFLIPNLTQSVRWVLFYWGLGFIFLIFLGLVFSTFFENRKYVLVGIWFSLPFFLENLVAKIFFPRHFFFTTSFLAIFLGITIDILFKRIKNKIVLILGLLLIFIPLITTDINILGDIKEVDFPEIERWQFFEGWPAGYGTKEAIKFIHSQIENEKIEIIVEKYGLLYYVSYTYLAPHPNLIVSNTLTVSSLGGDVSTYITSDSPKKFIILNQLQKLPDNWNVKLVGKYPKVANKTSIYIYKIIP